MKKKIQKSIFLMIIFILILITKSEATPGNKDFTDDVFYKAIIDNLNDNNYNSINNRDIHYIVTDEELESIKYLNIGKNMDDKEKVHNVKGLEKLKSLESLKINYPKIKEIDISKNYKLKYISILNANELKNIDFSNNVNLEVIDLTYTHLKNLNLANCPKLKSLNMGAGGVNDALIKELDLSECKELNHLSISGNKLESVDLSQNEELEYVLITSGTLKEVILPPNSKIETLTLFDNEIEKMEDIKNFETANNIKTLYIQKNNIKDFSLVYEKEGIIKKNLGIEEENTKEYDKSSNEKKENSSHILEKTNKYKNDDIDKKIEDVQNICEMIKMYISLGVPICFICFVIIISIKEKAEKLSGDRDDDLSGGNEDKRL